MKVQKIVAKVRSRNNIVLLYSVILFDSPYSKHCSKLSRVRIFEEITAKREINFFDGEFTLFFFQCPKMDTALNIFGTISQRRLCKGLYSPDTFLEIDRHELDRPPPPSPPTTRLIDICASLRAARRPPRHRPSFTR